MKYINKVNVDFLICEKENKGSWIRCFWGWVLGGVRFDGVYKCVFFVFVWFVLFLVGFFFFLDFFRWVWFWVDWLVDRWYSDGVFWFRVFVFCGFCLIFWLWFFFGRFWEWYLRGFFGIVSWFWLRWWYVWRFLSFLWRG